jgi:hypothetical protein
VNTKAHRISFCLKKYEKYNNNLAVCCGQV